LKTSDFFYELPPELFAQYPSPVRDASRLLVYERASKRISDRTFHDISDYMRPNDVLVRNFTRVIPARLFGVNEQTGAHMEFLLLKKLPGGFWKTLVKPGRRAKTGRVFKISDELSARIVCEAQEGSRVVEFIHEGIFEEILARVGQTPLPPYITEYHGDKDRYQTVYAREDGSAAAPTAGLHFTPELFETLRQKGVVIADILLHVGLGTFRPVSSENVEDHVMHSEYYEVSDEAAAAINGARAAGGRVFSVGTTSCRTLESVSDDEGVVRAGSGWTNIFITPGYKFKAVDALITNFHLPESTLLMLVSALCTREEMLGVYAHAIQQRYRFFSFGDAMLIL
jgi:S-adenosylmethionine:tRNA ribosyltransferase-isomerase